VRSRAGTAGAGGTWVNAVEREQMGRGMPLPPAHEVQRPGDTREGTEQINPGSKEVEDLGVEEEEQEEKEEEEEGSAGTWRASPRGGRRAGLVHCLGGHPAVEMLCPGSLGGCFGGGG